MLQQLLRLNDQLAALADEMSQSVIPAADAVTMMDAAAHATRLADACLALTVRRVEQLKAHRPYGARNAAAFVALHAGMSVGKAQSIVETAGALHETPTVRAALIHGRLSLQQAAEIIPAVHADPDTERTLVAAAQTTTFKQLHDTCQGVIAAATSDEDAYARARANRALRFRVEGAETTLDARFATADVAALILRINADATSLIDTARRNGIPLRKATANADALIGLLDTHKARPRTTVHLVCSQDAFDRGYTKPGDTCEIPGIGPITVGVVRTAAQTNPIRRIAQDGTEITRVQHRRPTIPARLRTALEHQYPTCSIIGCDASTNLQIDHIIDINAGGPTTLQNLHRVCEPHHAMKTHHGYTFTKNKDGTVQIHAPPQRQN